MLALKAAFQNYKIPTVIIPFLLHQISLPMAEPQTSERSVSVQTTAVTTAPPLQPVHHQAVHQHDGSVVQAAPALQTVQYLVPTSDNSNTASAVAAAGSGIQFAHANISGQNVIIQVVTPQPYADTAGAAPLNLPHNVVQDLLRVCEFSAHLFKFFKVYV